jgi:hypothetical protein
VLCSYCVTPREAAPRFPLTTSLGKPQSWSGHCGEERNLFPLLEIKRFIGHLARSLVTTPIELSQLYKNNITETRKLELVLVWKYVRVPLPCEL